MEQGGISIMSPPGVVEGSVGKPKSIGITLRSNGNMQTAKQKLKTSWLKNLIKLDVTLWDTFLAFLGEVIGTAILVFLGCTGCIGTMDIPPQSIQIAFTFGFAIMLAVQCVGHISGAHLNPAVTVAAVIIGNTSLLVAIFYVIAQCLGGLIGYGLLKIITPDDLQRAGQLEPKLSFCMTQLSPKISVAEGFATEFLATLILVFFICSAWDPRNARNVDSLSIKFAFCIAVLCLAFMPFTGCSMNPARTFAPAVWNNYWANHWLYWIGPLLGGTVAATVYRFVFLPKVKQEDVMQDVTTFNIET